MNNNNNSNNSIEKFVRENAVMMVQANPNRNRAKVYKCQDCNKEYDKFQALGGHRASHGRFKRKTAAGDKPELVLHVCKICKKEFESGHSLGGHMRTHYSPKNEKTVPATASCSSSNVVSIAGLIEEKDLDGKVVFEYDLNLTPVENEKGREK